MDQLLLLKCKRCKKELAKKGRSSCEGCLEKQRISSSLRRQGLKKNGLCQSCGVNQAESKSFYCKICLEKEKNNREFNKANGQCIHCNNLTVSGKTSCERCSNRDRKAEALKRKERKKNGICIKCGHNEVIKPHVKCGKCLSAQCKSWHDKVENFLKLGLCINCGEAPLTNNRFCEVCYLKNVANKRLGSSNQWIILKKLFDEQGKICPYTGIELILGSNASVDHIIPTSMGGDNSITNIQWTLSEVNEMKWNYRENNFLKLIKKIYEYKNLQREG